MLSGKHTKTKVMISDGVHVKNVKPRPSWRGVFQSYLTELGFSPAGLGGVEENESSGRALDRIGQTVQPGAELMVGSSVLIFCRPPGGPLANVPAEGWTVRAAGAPPAAPSKAAAGSASAAPASALPASNGRRARGGVQLEFEFARSRPKLI